MQVIYNRSGTPTINNILLNTIDVEHSCVEITFDDNRHELVGFESLYPYFINGQIAKTRCGDELMIGWQKHESVLHNLTSSKRETINALNYNWDYTYYDDNGNRNIDYDIMSFYKLVPIGNLGDPINGDYLIPTNSIPVVFDEIRLKDSLI